VQRTDPTHFGALHLPNIYSDKRYKPFAALRLC